MSQVIIPRIEVSGANAQTAQSIISGIGVKSCMGLIRKLALDLGQDDSHTLLIAVIHHHTEMRGEISKGSLYPAQLKGGALTAGKGYTSDYVKNGLAMGLQPVAYCNTIVSIVIDGLDESIGIDVLFEKLSVSRLAGGAIQRFGRPSRVCWDDILRTIGGGFFLKDRRDLLENVAPEHRIKAFIEAIHCESEKRKGDESRAWLTPMNLGFISLTEVKSQRDARKGLPHAYAEPLVGLVEYISKRKVDNEMLASLFWGYKKIGNAYLLQQ